MFFPGSFSYRVQLHERVSSKLGYGLSELYFYAIKVETVQAFLKSALLYRKNSMINLYL